MRQFGLTLAAVAVLAAGVMLANGRFALAAVAKPAAIQQAGGIPARADKAQYFYLDKPYCWYPYGWAGPGWYWCGYGTRVGIGWGGTYGWNGWAVPRIHRSTRHAPAHKFGRVP